MITLINIPQALREKLGETASKGLIQLLQMLLENFHTQSTETFENRFEKRLMEETGKLKIEMHALRADIIRWMFVFWIGQLASIIAVLRYLK